MAVAILGELTDRGLAVISGLGERLMAPILAAAMRARGLEAEAVDAGELIVTDDNYASAAPDMEATRARHPQPAAAPARKGRRSGRHRLRRGHARRRPDGARPRRLGLFGGDPRRRARCRRNPDLDGRGWRADRGPADRQGRPAAGGADLRRGSRTGLLRRQSPAPQDDAPGASTAASPISVRNTFNPGFPGTVSSPKSSNGGTVKALTVIRGLALVTVAGRGMMGVPGIAARTFAAVAAARCERADDLAGLVRTEHLLRGA